MFTQCIVKVDLHLVIQRLLREKIYRLICAWSIGSKRMLRMNRVLDIGIDE